MMWLPDGENFLNICLFILTEFTNITDGQKDGWADGRTDGDRMTA